MVRAPRALRQRLPRSHLSRLGRLQRLRGSLRPRGGLETPLRLTLSRLASFPRFSLRLRCGERVFARLRVPAQPTAQCASDSRGERSVAWPRSERGALDRADRRRGGRGAAGERRRGPESAGNASNARTVRSGMPRAARVRNTLEFGARTVELRVGAREKRSERRRKPGGTGYVLLSCGGRNTLCVWDVSRTG